MSQIVELNLWQFALIYLLLLVVITVLRVAKSTRPKTCCGAARA